MTSQTENPGSTGRRGNRRRNFIVNAPFQWKYTLIIATSVFIVASLMGLSLFGILHQQARDRVLFPGTMDTASNSSLILLYAVGFSVVVVGAMVSWGILMTHRISGPAFLLEQNIRALGEGRFPRRRPLRKRDEFKELHRTFWRAADSIKTRQQAHMAVLTELLETVRDASIVGGDRAQEALREVADSIEQLRRSIAEPLGEDVMSVPPVPAPKTRPAVEPALETAGSGA